MNTSLHDDILPATGTNGTGGITILYDDRQTGLAAMRFTDMIVASFMEGADHKLSCWRRQLVEVDAVAAEIAADVSTSEFIIFSLHSESRLSSRAMTWIDACLSKPARPLCVIGLFASTQHTRFSPNDARSWLRQAAGNFGLPFFAYSSTNAKAA